MGDELKEEQLDWLDAKLRDEMPYIDDAGFTARVAQRLPQPRRASRKLRAAILLVSVFVASAIAYIFAAPSLAGATAYLFALPPLTLWLLAGSLLMLLLVVTGTFALSKARETR